MTEMLDLDRYHDLDDLQTLDDSDLGELWGACPERSFYQSALDAALVDRFGSSAVGDAERLAVIDECLAYYAGQHPSSPDGAPRIPVLSESSGAVRWFKVSPRIRERLTEGLPMQETSTESNLPLPRLVLLGGAGIIIFLAVLILVRALSGGPGEAEVVVDLTPTVVPSPTPLALEDIDRPISAGEDLRDVYPVLLEVIPASSPSRVWPVQQREVAVAQWPFDPDPDVASALLGLAVRPVLGIPYSAANAEFLSALAPGDRLHLRLSTGAIRAYTVSERVRLDRQDEALFAQSAPGIALALLDEDAADRLVIYGDYLEEAGSRVTSGERLAPGETAVLGSELQVTVTGAALIPDPAGSPWAYLRVDLRLEAGEVLSVAPGDFPLVDAAGLRYAPLALPPARLLAEPLSARLLSPGERVEAGLLYLVGADAPGLALQAAGTLLPLDLGSASQPDPQVTLGSMSAIYVSGQAESLEVTLRVVNPGADDLTLSADDLVLVTSAADPGEAFPTGPGLFPVDGDDLPLRLAPGEARDLTVIFPWSGQPYAALEAAGWRWLAVFD